MAVAAACDTLRGEAFVPALGDPIARIRENLAST